MRPFRYRVALFSEACNDDDVASVDLLLREEPSLLDFDEFDLSRSVKYACRNGSLKVMEYFLDFAPERVRDSVRFTAEFLHEALSLYQEKTLHFYFDRSNDPRVDFDLSYDHAFGVRCAVQASRMYEGEHFRSLVETLRDFAPEIVASVERR